MYLHDLMVKLVVLTSMGNAYFMVQGKAHGACFYRRCILQVRFVLLYFFYVGLLVIVETKPDKSFPDASFRMDHYHLWRKDQNDGRRTCNVP